MTRSNIVLYTTIAGFIELVISIIGFNEKFRIVNSTLEFKYWLTCFLLYAFATFASIVHIVLTSDNTKREKKENYLEVFGTKHVNFMFTYHFLLFAFICFYLSSWYWCIMAGILFFIHNYIHRDNQNKYALDYAIEEAKIAAREPIILNNSDNL